MNHMGKRKRRADRNKTPPSPALTSHSSQMESSLKEKSSHSCGSSGVKPASSSLSNIMERSLSVHHQSSSYHRHHNVNRALLSRGPRHYYSIQQSPRTTANHAGTSTSRGKTALRDDKHSRKSGHKPESEFGYHAGKRDKALRKMDRIRSNPYHGPPKLEYIGAECPDFGNVLCRLCQQIMCEGYVLAVLVCGHIYHEDCLEKRTRDEDKGDPPCPLCMSSAVDN